MRNIILIGMPGVGKSTVGVVLAKTLGIGFIDTDLIIQQTKGKLLNEIIAEDGLEGFLKIEEEAILSKEYRGMVVATGGSAVFSSKAMEHLRNDGVIVYLNAPYEVIEKRLKNIKSRGVVAKEGQTILDIYHQRVPYYETYCDINIECENSSVEKTVEKIISKLK